MQLQQQRAEEQRRKEQPEQPHGAGLGLHGQRSADDQLVQTMQSQSTMQTLYAPTQHDDALRDAAHRLDDMRKHGRGHAMRDDLSLGGTAPVIMGGKHVAGSSLPGAGASASPSSILPASMVANAPWVDKDGKDGKGGRSSAGAASGMTMTSSKGGGEGTPVAVTTPLYRPAGPLPLDDDEKMLLIAKPDPEVQ